MPQPAGSHRLPPGGKTTDLGCSSSRSCRTKCYGHAHTLRRWALGPSPVPMASRTAGTPPRTPLTWTGASSSASLFLPEASPQGQLFRSRPIRHQRNMPCQYRNGHRSRCVNGTTTRQLLPPKRRSSSSRSWWAACFLPVGGSASLLRAVPCVAFRPTACADAGISLPACRSNRHHADAAPRGRGANGERSSDSGGYGSSGFGAGGCRLSAGDIGRSRQHRGRRWRRRRVVAARRHRWCRGGLGANRRTAAGFGAGGWCRKFADRWRGDCGI